MKKIFSKESNPKKKRMKLLIVFLGAFVILSSFAVAVVYLGFTSIVTGSVLNSAGSWEVLIFLQDFELDTTEGAVSMNNTFEFVNVNGNINVSLIEFNITRIAEDPTCPGYETDCSLTLVRRDQVSVDTVLLENDTFIAESGSNFFWIATSCKARSCPQNITTRIEIVPID